MLIQEYLVAYYYYDIVVDYRIVDLVVLVWSKHLFSASRICLTSCGIFFLLFRVLLCTHKTFQWVRWKSISFFSTRFTPLLLQLPIQNKKISQYIYKHLSFSVSLSHCFQFYRFWVLAHWRWWRWWWDTPQTSTWIFGN